MKRLTKTEWSLIERMKSWNDMGYMQLDRTAGTRKFAAAKKLVERGILATGNNPWNPLWDGVATYTWGPNSDCYRPTQK